MTAPVRFTEIAQLFVQHGVDTFVEVGPGKALVGMVKRTSGLKEGAKLLNIEDPKSLDAVVAALAG